ncbi:DUF2155 domain-containing protein [Rhodoplanes azumiensis]|uniref:DUF2155 domain-containing protein n=1 Tax=Rhodoplanes azumiensis TaxID=1897628 RepID=A0ABW5AJ01_9BRAD
MPGFSRAPLLLLGLLLTMAPAAAQFGAIFGEPPPRPPSSVPTRREPLPPPGSLQPVTPLPPEQFDEPPPLFPERRGAAPGGGATGIESQPLAPPAGAATAPAPGPVPSAAPATAARPGQPPAGAPGGGPATATAPPPAGGGSPPASGPAAPQLPEEVVTEVPTVKVPNPIAIFSGLDKITGRITRFEVSLGETVQYGALQVRPRACYTRPPTEAPNTTGFVEVDEVTLQGEVKKLFRGWMFASSPGLHGVEHSIYDVWLSDCKGAANVAEAPPPAPSPPAAAPPPRQQPRQQPAQQRQPRPPAAQSLPAPPRFQ